jgi:hypothetical protein
LRYKCLDERDDYHAILKRQSSMNHKQSQASNQVDDCDNDCDFGIASNIDHDYGDPNILGPTTIKKAKQMIEIETMMNQAGWLEQTENINLPSKICQIYPSVHNTGAQWKHIVKQC